MTTIRKCDGFTLIELLTVMAVMIIVTTIAVTSGFGLSRSAKYDSAVQLPVNALEYAHQRACMDGRDTAVVFDKGDDGQYYASIFQAVGTVAISSGKSITDRFSDMRASEVNGSFLTAFSFTSGGKFLVDSIEEEKGKVELKGPSDNYDFASDGLSRTYNYKAVMLKAQDAISGFKAGDTYGFEIADRIIMPANFTYSCSGGHKKGDAFWLVFTSNGAGDTADIAVGEAVANSKFGANLIVSRGNVSVKKKF